MPTNAASTLRRNNPETHVENVSASRIDRGESVDMEHEEYTVATCWEPGLPGYTDRSRIEPESSPYIRV